MIWALTAILIVAVVTVVMATRSAVLPDPPPPPFPERRNVWGRWWPIGGKLMHVPRGREAKIMPDHSPD